MKGHPQVRKAIKWKLLTAMIGLILGLLIILTFIQITAQKSVLEGELERRVALMKDNLIERGKTSSDNLARQVENSIASFNFSIITEVTRKAVEDDDELSHVILMDKTRKVMVHTSRPDVIDEILTSSEDHFANEREEAAINEYIKNETPYLEIIVPITVSTVDWGVLRLVFSLDHLNKEIVSSRAEIAKQNSRMVVRSILTSFAFLIFSTVIVLVISTRLSKPLTRLTEIARELATGNFDAASNIMIESEDEAGVLADAFKEMSSNLKESYAKLEDYSRTLEEKVQERTSELEAANTKLKEIDKVKSDFLSTVSHELRTPLTSVLGFASIIDKKLGDTIYPAVVDPDKKTRKVMKQVTDNLGIIVQEGTRLTSLINDVLDLAKIESGKIEWKEEEVNMSNLFAQVAKSLESIVDSNNLYIKSEVESSAIIVKGDRHRLIQVVTNLFSNALKFTDTGGVTYRIKRVGEEVRCEVDDTGSGVPIDMYETIFDKFRQVGDTLTDRPSGTGLGLPICKEIIKHHKGRIWIEGKDGPGSNFIFHIPVLAESSPRMEIEKDVLLNSIREHLSSGKEGVQETILVVDDDASIRSMLVQELRERGYTTLEAENARDAIVKARTMMPDLMLLDIMMPDLSGYDVLRVLKNDDTALSMPIIIVSVLEDKDKGIMLGACDYVTKPVDKESLFKSIATALKETDDKRTNVVMIVERDKPTLKSLSEALSGRGFEVIECGGDRGEILEGLKRSPDLLLVDMEHFGEECSALMGSGDLSREKLLNSRIVYMIKGNG